MGAADSQVLGQAADETGDQFLAETRNVPREVVGLDSVQSRHGHVDGEAILNRAGLEVIADREGQPLTRLNTGPSGIGSPADREVGLAYFLGRVVGEHRRIEGQELGAALPLGLPPRVEMRAADDLSPDARVIEVEQGALVDDDAAPPGAVLQFLGLGQHP